MKPDKVIDARQMNPDSILELAIDLVDSYITHRDITYGGKVWSASVVAAVLDTLDLWLIPCINPDGRNYVMTTDDLWRKNRRTNRDTSCDGVDLNRNTDVMWGVIQGSTSCDPCSSVYTGPEAFSEPETRNVKYVLDNSQIDCFVDVHSFSELVLFPWGHAPTQTTDSSQRFTDLPNGTCSPIRESGYAEFMPPDDVLRYRTLATEVVDAIAGVGGQTYTAQTSQSLYPTTGTFTAYGYARHIADPRLHKTFSFAFETGPENDDVAAAFHPDNPEPIKDETKSGMLAMAHHCVREAGINARSIVVSIDFDGRDDENIVADEKFDPSSTWFRVNPSIIPTPVTYRWGGELRAEYTFVSVITASGAVEFTTDCLLFEGTSTSTSDLDGQGSLTVTATEDSWSQGTLLVTNTSEGDPDDFGRLRIVVQNNPAGLLGLFSMWNANRGDNHLTSNPLLVRVEGHEPDGYGIYRRQGLVFDPEQPQPPGTTPLVSWWNSSRTDNWATTDPGWSGLPGRQRDDYGLYRIEGFIYPPDRPQPAGTVPLMTWWHGPDRNDHFSSTRAKWQRPVGTFQEGYRAIRLEGFVFAP